jgi:hypothetical protein
MNGSFGLALAAVALATVSLLAACGEEQELDVVEGEPVELGELSFNVQLTRFLNPDDPEDEAYLRGQPLRSADQQYLAVFMTVDNEGDQPAELPSTMTIRDTRDNTYQPLDTASVYALELGTTLPAGDELPRPDTPAATGPIRGAMVLFRVDRAVTENRPIELEIPSASTGGEQAQVELDI